MPTLDQSFLTANIIKSLVAAVALTIGLAGYAVGKELAHRHRQHEHHIPPGPSAYLRSGAPAYVPAPSAGAADIYWSPAGGDPTHYAQTTGFYAGR
jgi:hypothetical protein